MVDRVLLERVLHVARDIRDHKRPYSQQIYFNECGSPACLAGYCTEDPVLQRAGLRRITTSKNKHLPGIGAVGDELMADHALRELFDLTTNQTYYIFGCETSIRDAMIDVDGVDDEDLDGYDFGSIDNVIQRVQDVLDGWGE
jgi:hypothetical protein